MNFKTNQRKINGAFVNTNQHPRFRKRPCPDLHSNKIEEDRKIRLRRISGHCKIRHYTVIYKRYCAGLHASDFQILVDRDVGQLKPTVSLTHGAWGSQVTSSGHENPKHSDLLSLGLIFGKDICELWYLINYS